MPVKPVCPNDPIGNSSPRFDEYDESMSQPSPRTARISGGVEGEVIRATVAGDRTRAPPSSSAGEQHPAEARQVGRGAEQTRMSGDAVHPARSWIVHDAAQERVGPAARPGQRPARLGRRDARAPRFGRKKLVSCIAERFEDVRLRVSVEALAAHAADDVAEQKEVDVAVDEALARRGGRHFFDRAANRFVGAVELDLEIEIGTEPRRVRQQVPDRDAAPCRTCRSRGCTARPDRSGGCRPSSTSFITLVVVATTLVSEARSKIVSSVIGSGAGATARRPNAR